MIQARRSPLRRPGGTETLVGGSVGSGSGRRGRAFEIRRFLDAWGRGRILHRPFAVLKLSQEGPRARTRKAERERAKLISFSSVFLNQLPNRELLAQTVRGCSDVGHRDKKVTVSLQ